MILPEDQFSALLGSLRVSDLFRDFLDHEIREFLVLADAVNVKAGDLIVRQDDVGDSMYIIAVGTVRVIHHRGGEYIALATMRPGEFFGEFAVIDHGPRCADVQAMEDCQLFRVSEGLLHALAGVYPAAAVKFLMSISRMLVHRLRRSNLRYIDSLLVS